MSGHKVTCGNCYKVIHFVISDLVLRPRPASSDYPNGFLMTRCSYCEYLNPPSGMLEYELIQKEWTDHATKSD